MYHRLAVNITNSFVKNNIIDAEKSRLYAYGFEVLFSTIAYTMIFLAIALLTQTFINSLMFFIGFFLTRRFCGGYHAKTYTGCHLLFACNHLLFILANKFLTHLQNNWVIGSGLLLSAILVFLFAPVDHPNKPFVKNEYQKFKVKSRLHSIFLTMLAILLYLGIWNQYTDKAFGLMFGIFSATISLLCAKIQKQRRTSQ